MVVVSVLRVAPVKALGTVRRDVVRLERDGVRDDRRLFLLDDAGRVVTLRRHPQLTRLVPSLDLDVGTVSVTTPDGTTWTSVLHPAGDVLHSTLFGKERRGRAVPGEVADAISEHAGERLRLVLADDDGTGWDEGPVSILARASAAAVHPPDGADPQARFRMLVEVTGVPAFGEEAWVGGRLRIGEALVEVTHPLGRCVVINHSPATGAQDWNGLHGLTALRGHARVELGVIASVVEPGPVRVGDAVTACAAGR